MTGRERVLAAFSESSASDLPAVICYEGIYIRDRWRDLSSRPWWHRQVPDLERQLDWRRDVITAIDQDWFRLAGGCDRDTRAQCVVEERGSRVVWRDSRTGEESDLVEPSIGGWSPSGGHMSMHPEDLPASPTEVDDRVPLVDPDAWQDPGIDGRADLARALLAEWGARRLPIWAVSSPFWDCYRLWGFEGLMLRVADDPELVIHACERLAGRARAVVRDAAAFGAEAIWVEETLTDQLSPEDFARINLPVVQRLMEEIAAAGLKSIYYYCGDPAGKWDSLLAAGADALAFEESKKGFRVDIDEVVERVAGRCTVLGNLDAVGVLQDGSHAQLRAEIARQIEAGRRNGSRFIMSLGSPVTPDTPVARVRQYCDLAHELGAAT